jgi:Fe-S oxidoreductase
MPSGAHDGAVVGRLHGAGGGFQGAVEMCNNNGACRSLSGGVMCPSYRVTLNEKDLTRGRANSLRLAISGQLGPDAFTSEEMFDTLKLCVSCKGCRRECPTGVDIAKMKIEVLAARAEKHGLSLRDRLVAYLPRYAGFAAKLSWLMNLRNGSPLLRRTLERLGGISAQRDLPVWRRDPFAPTQEVYGPEGGREVVLFADTFNRAFERENLDAALTVLGRGGLPRAPAEARRREPPAAVLRPHLPRLGPRRPGPGRARAARGDLCAVCARGVPLVGLEPSCLLTLRDELLSIAEKHPKRRKTGFQAGLQPACDNVFQAYDKRWWSRPAMVATPGPSRPTRSCSRNSWPGRRNPGRLALPLKPVAEKALVHGHCHQKAFDAFKPVVEVLKLVPGLQVETVESSCCGMAGAFGYGADTYDVSIAMGELSLLPPCARPMPARSSSRRHLLPPPDRRRHGAAMRCMSQGSSPTAWAAGAPRLLSRKDEPPTLSPLAGRGARTPCRVRAERSEGEGLVADRAHAATSPSPSPFGLAPSASSRTEPLSPQAGRGGRRAPSASAGPGGASRRGP